MKHKKIKNLSFLRINQYKLKSLDIQYWPKLIDHKEINS